MTFFLKTGTVTAFFQLSGNFSSCQILEHHDIHTPPSTAASNFSAVTLSAPGDLFFFICNMTASSSALSKSGVKSALLLLVFVKIERFCEEWKMLEGSETVK